jgi:UDP-N-acetylmuramate--alanine ligase
MHIFFSGIGGAGIGPLALIAHQAGFTVSGSDKQDSGYIDYLRSKGLSTIGIGQTEQAISALHAKNPIDWFVYSSALPMENPAHPELVFCQQQNIKLSKRDEFINLLLTEKGLKMVAIAGTHGKTTTTAMVVWLFKQMGVPVSYSVGAKLSYGDMGEYVEGSQYFIYEADEYDRNFLSFSPALSLITGIDWDHPDVYPTRDDYYTAFQQFIGQSTKTVAWLDDLERIGLTKSDAIFALHKKSENAARLKLLGEVNRQDGWLALNAVNELIHRTIPDLIRELERFPGLSRRFEKITENVYSDYAHTPEKIRGALQLAHEVAGENVVVVYEGLHNTRQHFIKEDLAHLFDSAKHVYIVPSYLAREDESLELLTPEKLVNLLSNPQGATPSELNDQLIEHIKVHQKSGDLILCLSAGGGGSLDEWLRKEII